MSTHSWLVARDMEPSHSAVGAASHSSVSDALHVTTLPDEAGEAVPGEGATSIADRSRPPAITKAVKSRPSPLWRRPTS
jgi:hypothetical protein